jgi:hypothetical protein
VRGRPLAVAAIVAAALAAGGCGQSEEEDAAEDARATAERYVEALKEGDAEAACEELSQGSLAEISDQAGGGDCAATLAPVITRPESRDAVANLEVVDVNASGETATATITGGPEEITNELVLEDGEWKLASPGGVGEQQGEEEQ